MGLSETFQSTGANIAVDWFDSLTNIWLGWWHGFRVHAGRCYSILLCCLFIYLALPTRAGSPQQHMPITVGPFCLTHPVNFRCLLDIIIMGLKITISVIG